MDLKILDLMKARWPFNTAPNTAATKEIVGTSELASLFDARPDTAAQIEKMAKIYGMTSADFSQNQAHVLDIVKSCNGCDCTDDCRAFLDGKKVSFSVRSCPNAGRYKEVL